MTPAVVTSAALVEVTSTMGDMADPIPLPELCALLAAAEQADDRTVVTGAEDLLYVAQASIQAHADRRAWEATRNRTSADVAAEWAISKWTLAQRRSRHNKRLRQSEQ